MHPIGVVPIFMSAGAAVLPTLIAAVTSVAAIVFKPRELVRQFRLRPALMSGILAGVALFVGLLTLWVITPATAQARSISQKTDWAEVANNIIAQERLHAAENTTSAAPPSTTQVATPSAPSGTPPAPRGAPDFSRTMFAGALAPTHLTQAWKYRPDDAAVFLSDPAISADGKRIYVAGCVGEGGKYLGILACLNADTGKPIWEKVTLNGDAMKPFFSSPALSADEKYLIIGQGLHEDKDCSLLCFNTANGDLKWQVKTTLHIESSPAIFGDMAVVGAGAIEGANGLPTGDPGFVFAVRISDGTKLWQQAVNDPESSPVIDADGTVFIGSGFNGTAVVALRSQSDEQLKAQGLPRIKWKVPTEFPVTGPLTLCGDMLLAGGGNGDMVKSAPTPRGQVTALNRKTGEVLWRVTTTDSILGSIAATPEFIICPSRSGEILGLAAKDGSPLWRARISGNSPVVAGVALGAGKVYGLSADGNLAIIDAAHGDLLEKVYVNEVGARSAGLSMCTPRVWNGRLIVGSETGGIRMYVGQ